jgi:hypothetical protein
VTYTCLSDTIDPRGSHGARIRRAALGTLTTMQRRASSGWVRGTVLVVALLVTACATPAPEKSSRVLPLSEDERYMRQVREQINKVATYPCIQVTETNCEYKAAELEVEISVLQSGELQYVKVIRSSGFEVYDSYAVNAVRLAAPYPPVPPF